jgi:dihydrolipoamide dehydrogenase
MSQHAIVVPDIGDYSDVPVIEVLVKVGDAIEKEQPLIVLESDKATMEVPADQAGIVTSLTIKVGDKVSKGSVIGQLEVSAAASASTPAVTSSPAITKSPTPPPVAPAAIPVPAGAYQGKVQHECEVLVLGAGPGGYSAAFRSADLGANVILVERYPTLGGVCLNVGCIPSKALLHTAAVMDEVKHMAKHGIEFAPPKINLDQLRQHKEGVIAKLTGGLAGMAKMRKVNVVRGLGRFLDAHHLEVDLCTGSGQDLSGQKEVIRFQKAIIAAGSQPIALPFMPKDPRVVDSTGALLLQSIPKRMLVIGGGIIGLEMATVYSALGSRIDIVEMMDGLMAGADRDLERVWEKMNAHRFDRIMLKTRAVRAEAKPDGIEVFFEGEKAPDGPQQYDLVLVAVGRTPNGKKIDASAAGVQVDERGFIPVDAQMRTNVANIFAIGDIVGQPMLAHKAVHVGHVAAEAAAGQ